MKLLKRDRTRLELIMREAQEGIDFIMDKDTAIMRSSKLSSSDVFTASYYKGEAYNKIMKEAGSKLCFVFNAFESLKKALSEV